MYGICSDLEFGPFALRRGPKIEGYMIDKGARRTGWTRHFFSRRDIQETRLGVVGM